MKVICLTSFVHGAQHLQAGAKAEFSSVTADELIDCGLVKKAADEASPMTKKAPEPSNKAAPAPKNKGARTAPAAEAPAPSAETPAPAAEAPPADAPAPAPEAPAA